MSLEKLMILKSGVWGLGCERLWKPAKKKCVFGDWFGSWAQRQWLQKPAGLAGCSSFARADVAGGLGARAKCYDVDPYRLYRLYRHQLTSMFGDQLKAEELYHTLPAHISALLSRAGDLRELLCGLVFLAEESRHWPIWPAFPKIVFGVGISLKENSSMPRAGGSPRPDRLAEVWSKEFLCNVLGIYCHLAFRLRSKWRIKNSNYPRLSHRCSVFSALMIWLGLLSTGFTRTDWRGSILAAATSFRNKLKFDHLFSHSPWPENFWPENSFGQNSRPNDLQNSAELILRGCRKTFELPWLGAPMWASDMGSEGKIPISSEIWLTKNGDWMIPRKE